MLSKDEGLIAQNLDNRLGCHIRGHFVPQGISVVLDLGKFVGAIEAGDIEQLRYSADITM